MRVWPIAGRSSGVDLDAMIMPSPLQTMAPIADGVARNGFGGVTVTETSRSTFLASAAIALAQPNLHISTGVAVAFPRSPMVTAGAAWELAEATGGRFRLGLGAQVRAHVVRRYSAAFDPPGPRLEEYVGALRAIFSAFAQEEKLDFHGDFWDFDLLPRAWAPGGESVEPPPIDVAAVNPWMLRMAGRCADGVHVHPLNTLPYLGTVLENVGAGALEADRDVDGINLLVPCFTVVGDTDEEQAKWRELARMQVGFYGSTPNYSFIFDQLGHEGVGMRLNEAGRKGDRAAQSEIVTDEILSNFVVEAEWDSLAPSLVARYAAFADRVILYFANPLMADAESMERFGEVATQVAHLTDGSKD